ncbi:MAG: hypothetical protein JHD03_05005 [Solirubrobacteraceae bacterium]|nr:hypothetical protein [Solirubrobacteraceae bacterium]
MTDIEARRGLTPRILLSLLAAAAIGWLLISWHDERLQTEGIMLLAEQPPRPVEAIERFRDAGLLSASLQPKLFEASIVYLLGDREKAISDQRALLLREPRNRTGWLLLGNWLLVSDPGAAAIAFRQAELLDGRIPSPPP